MHALTDFTWFIILYAPFIAMGVIQLIAMAWAYRAVQTLGGERGLSKTLKIVYTILWPFVLLLWLLHKLLKA